MGGAGLSDNVIDTAFATPAHCHCTLGNWPSAARSSVLSCPLANSAFVSRLSMSALPAPGAMPTTCWSSAIAATDSAPGG